MRDELLFYDDDISLSDFVKLARDLGKNTSVRVFMSDTADTFQCDGRFIRPIKICRPGQLSSRTKRIIRAFKEYVTKRDTRRLDLNWMHNERGNLFVSFDDALFEIIDDYSYVKGFVGDVVHHIHGCDDISEVDDAIERIVWKRY